MSNMEDSIILRLRPAESDDETKSGQGVRPSIMSLASPDLACNRFPGSRNNHHSRFQSRSPTFYDKGLTHYKLARHDQPPPIRVHPQAGRRTPLQSHRLSTGPENPVTVPASCGPVASTTELPHPATLPYGHHERPVALPAVDDQPHHHRGLHG
jgi:hypothetical protein